MKGFILKISKNFPINTLNQIKIISFENEFQNEFKTANGYICLYDEKWTKQIETESSLQLIIGDVIDGEINKPLFVEDNYPSGFYYKLEFTQSHVKVYTSLFNIFPVYYIECNDSFYISSNIQKLIEVTNHPLTINKQYILQQNLFNYSIGNQTIYKEIHLLNTNHYLSIDFSGIHEYQHTKIENFFTENPKSLKQSLPILKKLFIERTEKYFPNEPFAISFTSGFDGRTLVAIAKYLNKPFSAYSFGNHTSNDLYIPQEQAKKLGFNFHPIILDEIYAQNYFLQVGKNYIANYGATTNFLQVHFNYGFGIIGQDYRFAINGMFGSELFRALHISGQFTSMNTVTFFKNMDKQNYYQLIIDSPSLKYLNKDSFSSELNELGDILSDYRKSIIHLNENQRFYNFVFNVAFSKIFGQQWIVPQLPNIMQRSPYLDFKFIRELLKTEFAGVNNQFFTHNPLKRFKGQLFYAHLLKDTWPELSRLTTGKGYRSDDLLSLYGKLNITARFAKKKLMRSIKKEDLNNLGILSAFSKNYNFFSNLNINEDLYNKAYIIQLIEELKGGNTQHRDKLLETLSTIFYLQDK